MPAQITSDLRQVLETRDPDKVSLIIEAEPEQGDLVREKLKNRGIEFRQTTVGDMRIFKAVIDATLIESVANERGVGRIDHNPRFSPHGVSAISPNAAIETEDTQHTDLYSVTEQMGVEDAWENADSRGEGITVGIIDTPVDTTHPAYEHAIAAQDHQTGSDDHGTWVASAIAAKDTKTPKGRVRGVAPDADLVVSGALAGGGADLADIGDSIQFCIEHECDVINMSFGGVHSETMHRFVQEATKAGVTCITSAGNSGPGRSSMSCPAHHSEPVSVASVSLDGEVASFSSRGPGWFDAPRSPDVACFGGHTDLLDSGALAVTEAILGAGRAGTYVRLMGTSMAAPLVAGTAALRHARLRSDEGGDTDGDAE